jgi:hypothetical protein
MLTGCVGEDRDEDILPGPEGADDGAEDPGDGDDPGDDGDEPGDDGDDGDPGTGDDTGDPGDDGGDTGDTGDDGATDDPGDDGGSEGAPDCESMWIGQYIPATQYMKMKIPETADEMFCYLNMERINYQFHGRNSGCIWSGGDGSSQVTWPYEMLWDADLTAAAQAEAEAVAGGSPPAGTPESNGMDHTLYAHGCATTEYTVTSPNDLYEHWPDPEAGHFPSPAAGLSNSNGTARMGVHYYDPGPNSPTLRRMGVGLAEVGDTRYWVVKFGE